MKRQFPVLKIVLIVWVAFSVLYVGYTQYQYFTKVVASSAYQHGLSEAVMQVIQQAQKCDPFQVQIDGRGVYLLNADCVKNQPAAAPSNGDGQ